jgi:hypothetical protein
MSHNPQALLSRGKLVKIHKRRCQAGSEFATFFDFFWREDEPWVVLRLSTGRRIAMPTSWTDLPRSAFPSSDGQAELLPSALLELSQHLRELRSKLLRRTRSKRRSKNHLTISGKALKR